MDNEIEKITQALINGDPPPIEEFEPKSRSEEYLKSALMKTKIEDLPNPQSRLDVLLCMLNDNIHKEYGTKFEEGYSEGYDIGVADGHTEDYEDGYTNGYEDGNAEGNAVGYESGHADGYDAGREVGHSEGYEEGYTSGHNAGHTEAYNTGYSSGYNKGYDAGHTEDYHDGYDEGYRVGNDEGIEEGKELGYNDMVNVLANNGTRTYFGYIFRTCVDMEEAPYFDTSKGTLFDSMFYECKKLKTIPQYDFSKANRSNDIFAFCTSLEELPDMSTPIATSTTYAFYNCTKLKKIAKIDISKVASYGYLHMFTNCTSLTDLTVAGVINYTITFASCPLSAASAKSVINALKNYKGTDSELAYTVSFNSDVWARLNEAEAPPREATWQEYVNNVLGWNT